MEINKVYNGDCLDLMRDIPDKSIDMILCDLPYGTTNCKWDVIIPFEPLWEQYKRIIKDNGAIVLTASQPFTSQLVMSNPKMFKYEWIWDKTDPSGFVNAKLMPIKSIENILVFSKGKTSNGNKNNMIYHPQNLIECNKIVNAKRNKLHENSFARASHKEFHLQQHTNYPKQILKFANDKKNKLHPTQKPVALFEYLIKTYTNDGETVLDNCSGSGTTAIACLNTNRNYILMEKDEEYFNLSVERIDKHIKQNHNDNKLF